MPFDFTFCQGCTDTDCIRCGRIRTLEKAEREGRLVIKEPLIEGSCGTCQSFYPETGKSSGPCYTRHDRMGKYLYVCRSRNACRYYKRREWEDEK